MALTRSEQDYLKAILKLTADSARASTGDLAADLGISPASATHMLRKLAAHRPPLVDYRKHRGACLTDAGRHQALVILRRHRLIELFLHRALGFGWDEVHEEAERLEHVISSEFERRVTEALGNPIRDPHGEPIPTPEADLPPIPGMPLTEMRPGQSGIVRQVASSPPDLLRHLAGIGLIPEARVVALGFSDIDEVLQLRVEGRADPVAVGPAVSRSVTVEVE